MPFCTRGDGMAAASLFAAFLGDAGSFGGDQLVQHHLVPGKELVQGLVIGQVAHVHGSDQLDRHPRPLAVGRNVPHHSRFHGERLALVVAVDADEPRLGWLGLRVALSGGCGRRILLRWGAGSRIVGQEVSIGQKPQECRGRSATGAISYEPRWLTGPKEVGHRT